HRQETAMEEVGKVLPAIFKNYMRHVEPPVVEILAPLWSHVVGKAIAQHSRPFAFASGTLRIVASCPSWAVQLRRMSEEIRMEVNRYLGRAVVRKLIVRHASNAAVVNRAAPAAIEDSNLKAADSSGAGSPSLHDLIRTPRQGEEPRWPGDAV